MLVSSNLFCITPYLGVQGRYNPNIPKYGCCLQPVQHHIGEPRRLLFDLRYSFNRVIITLKLQVVSERRAGQFLSSHKLKDFPRMLQTARIKAPPKAGRIASLRMIGELYERLESIYEQLIRVCADYMRFAIG